MNPCSETKVWAHLPRADRRLTHYLAPNQPVALQRRGFGKSCCRMDGRGRGYCRHFIASALDLLPSSSLMPTPARRKVEVQKVALLRQIGSGRTVLNMLLAFAEA